jgi:DNA processing protein
MDEIRELKPKDFPALLAEINDPPKKLYIRGGLPSEGLRYLTVVGSRKYSSYGKEVCEKLISGLRGFPIVIVSGLALGMDAIAHKSALVANLPTIAVPGSGLSDEVLHPRTNFKLAHEILASGGALISEFEPDFRPTLWSFPKRNRIMAGLSHSTLLIEAGEKSGTLITARLAMEYNRDVMAIPGPIFSKSHAGSNHLIKDGAHLITSSTDILEILGMSVDSSQLTVDRKDLSKEEKRIVEILEVEPLSKDDLLGKLDMPITKANILLSAMELKGLIKESLGKVALR